MKIKKVIGALLSFVLSACAAPVRSSAQGGLWQSEGYGLLLEIERGEVKVWQTTRSSCLLAFVARRERGVPEGGPEGTEAIFLLPEEVGGLRVQIRADGQADQRRLKVVGAASDIVLKRVAEKPVQCADARSSGPVQTFEVFVQTFREQYPFFGVRGVDWEAAVAHARKEITASSSPALLAQTLSGLIAPLQDAHTFLTVPGQGDQDFEGFRSPQTGPRTLAELALRRDQIAGAIAASLQGGLQEYANRKIRFGWLDRAAGLGYLRVTGFEKYSRRAGYAEQLAALDQALDAVFTPDLRGLVIDVRINPGGLDGLGLALMSRLSNRRFLAYRKAARNDPGDAASLTAPADVYVEPSARARFAGPLVVMTSAFTISAAETFTLASMQRPETTVRVGSVTQGAFSDMQDRVLPNGWHFGLPNEVYETPAGRRFEAHGVPPDVEVESSWDQSPGQNRDPALEQALRVLRELKAN